MRSAPISLQHLEKKNMAVITAVIMWVFLENVMPVLPMPSLDVLPTGNFSLYKSLF